MNRLLILACSGTKDPIDVLLPAHMRYRGALWSVLSVNRPRTGSPLGHVEVLAVSARYGVISERHEIANYDTKMTRQRSEELMRERFEDPWPASNPILARSDPIAVFDGPPLVICSEYYLPLAKRALRWMRQEAFLRRRQAPIAPVGGIGTQRGVLKRWLTEPETIWRGSVGPLP